MQSNVFYAAAFQTKQNYFAKHFQKATEMRKFLGNFVEDCFALSSCLFSSRRGVEFLGNTYHRDF